MAKETTKDGNKITVKKRETTRNGGMGGVGYLMTVVGAAVYFVQQSEGFWVIVLALLKALVWPAFAAHRAFELMGL